MGISLEKKSFKTTFSPSSFKNSDSNKIGLPRFSTISTVPSPGNSFFKIWEYEKSESKKTNNNLIRLFIKH